MEKLVSVIIPFYSGVDLLCEAVQSVLDQTYKNMEIIVVNDGSKEDMTVFLEKYGDKIKYFYQENKGPAAARNLAIKNASGDYYALLDSDDIWLPDKTERQIKFMQESGCKWSHTAFSYWWPVSNELKTIDIRHNYGWVLLRLYVSFRIATPAVIIDATCYKEHPGFCFPENMRYGQDSGLFMQIARYYPIGLLDAPLAKVRMRGTNTNSRALVRIKVKSMGYDAITSKSSQEEVKPMAKFILSIYKVNGKIVGFFRERCKFSEASLEKVAKVLWVFPYTLERLYTFFIINTTNYKAVKQYYCK